eukprot:Hpha_TRINITY_DN13209_c0_g3::TRINITY_DN13209_c0_g3_i1::g.154783::m.154783
MMRYARAGLAMGRVMQMQTRFAQAAAKEKVVVLCTGNSCRSHIAEGMVRKYLGDRYDVVSAGTKPTGYVHPLAQKVLEEEGIDVSGHKSKHVDELKDDYNLALGVTVCGNAENDKPEWLSNSVHIGFADPADATGTEEEQLKIFRDTREQIRKRLLGYLEKKGEGKDGDTLASVQEYYGKVLSSSKDLKTSACTASGRPHPIILDIIKKIPAPVNDKFYGCGTPIPLGIDGKTVLDLGSGSGRDAYVAGALVGPKGKVIGIDMTDEQLSTARENVDEYTKTLGYSSPNIEFKKGYIEDIEGAGVAPGTVDLILSNCVINLSPNKPAILKGAYEALREGGELYFSDVYCDRRVPKEAQENEVLWGECISGAMYIEDFLREAQKVGFADPRQLEASEIVVQDPQLAEILGEARFYSITYRLFKLPGLLESKCEDYGQYALYKGTVPGHPHSFVLDDHHKLERNKPFLVCGNTAAMLGENGVSWLSPHFTIVGDRSVHYGLFDCGPSPVASSPAAAAGGACC